jgi:signal transduction histidine kinase/ligand-binding sensor domain-containing protein/DNA-binding response OmpR family regulator
MRILLLIISILFAPIISARGDNTRVYDSSLFNCNNINIIAQDSAGFLWVGTDYGLNRFDGVHFVRYNHVDGDPASLLNNFVHTLLVDNQKRMWVGTNSGLQYYCSETNDFVAINTGENMSVEEIVHLSNDKIWFITPGKGVWEVDWTNQTASPVEWLNEMCAENHYSDICQDSAGRVWLGSGKGLVCVDVERQTKLTVENPIENEHISDIVQAPDGTLYVSTSLRVLRLDETDNNPRFEEIFDTESVYLVGMYVAQDGTIYLGTNGEGVKYIKLNGKQLKSVAIKQIPEYVVNRGLCSGIIEDRQHNLWISYKHFGVVKVDMQESYFHHHNLQEHDFGRITAMYSTPDEVLCGFESVPVLVGFDKKSYRKREISVPGGVRAILRDRNNTYWLGTYYKGLVTWREGDRTVKQVEGLSTQWIYAIAEDDYGNLYLSDFAKGLKRYNTKTGDLQIFVHNKENGERQPSLSNNWVNVLMRDSRGMLWVGHYKGVDLYNTHTQRFIALPFDNILSSEICQALLEDHNGNVWIGTKSALYKYTLGNRTLKRLTIADGLSNDVICNLQQDSAGNIWCSTLDGINQISEDGTKIVCYYAGNGLQDNTYYAAGCRDGAGQLYFGGHKGITDFDPTKISCAKFSTSVAITNTYVNGERVNVKDNITLKHYDNTLAFDLSTMDFRPPENTYYQYRIPQLDNKWNATSPGDHEITYHSLPPGKYTLQFLACENNITSGMEQMNITIRPPWYQTVLAKIIYFLIACALIFQVIYTLKKRRREEINEAKLQFFINIAHEIRSPMTLVMSPLEALMKREQNPDTLKTLGGIHRNARRIVRLINQLLDIRKIDKGQMNLVFSEIDLIPFIGEQIGYWEEQAKKRNIRLSFEHSDQEIRVCVDPHNFDKVLLNLLDNALKYTPEGGEVTVRTTIQDTSQKEKCVCIEVLDTGAGIEAGEQKKIFDRFYQIQKSDSKGRLPGFGIGLNLCRLLVDLHHGTIEVKNRIDRSGSDFIVCLPLSEQPSSLKPTTVLKTTPPVSDNKPTATESIETTDVKQKKRTHYSVLIVDDNDELRTYIAEELEKTYQMYVAANGKEGIKMAFKHHPDIIISDVIMPETDGFELLRTLKNNYETSHIPIVLLTSKSEHLDRITAFEKGADYYLSKPFNIDELEAIIANLINNRLRLKGVFAGTHPQDNTTAQLDIQDQDKELMRKVMRVVDEHIGDQALSVDMIAQEIGLSRAQLHRRLKDIAGVSAGKLIQNIRLTKAAQLLKESSVNISQLAYAVGYTSPSNFSTAFKNYFGVSPKEYVEQLEKGNPPQNDF